MDPLTTDQSGDYFSEAYRDYCRQSPDRKFDHYLNVIITDAGSGPLDLLDVGCGPGAFLARTKTIYPDWHLSGIDIQEAAVRQASAAVPGAEIRVASASGQSFPSGAFDVITAWDSIEHVEDIDRVGKAIRAMLTPTGLFFFVVPVYDGVTGPLIRRLDKDPTHIHRESRGFWLNWAAEWFEVIRWHGIYRYLLPTGWYVHMPTRTLRNHTAAVLVGCRVTRRSR